MITDAPLIEEKDFKLLSNTRDVDHLDLQELRLRVKNIYDKDRIVLVLSTGVPARQKIAHVYYEPVHNLKACWQAAIDGPLRINKRPDGLLTVVEVFINEPGWKGGNEFQLIRKGDFQRLYKCHEIDPDDDRVLRGN